jgi:hypothetical protein
MGRSLASVFALLLFCSVALCQSPRNKVELYGGYSLVTGDFTGTYADRQNHVLSGWEATAAYKPGRLLGLAADFSGFYPSYTFGGLDGLTAKARSLSYLFGPQVSIPLPKVSPFAHALLGATYIGYPQPSGCPECKTTSDNSFSYAEGGGIDYHFGRHLGWRGQADLFHDGATSSDNQLTYKFHQNVARISTGILFRF